MNIDRIAREMVDVEPSGDLEARIRRRLNEARPNRTAAWWTWRVAVPVGTIASLALAFVVVQSPEMPVGVQGSRSLGDTVGVRVSGTPSVVSSRGPQVPTSQVAKVRSSPGPQVPRSQVSRVPASQLTSEEMAWMDRRLPALEPVNALQMDHLRVDSIQPEPLAITPLTMTPVGTEGAGMERRNDR